MNIDLNIYLQHSTFSSNMKEYYSQIFASYSQISYIRRTLLYVMYLHFTVMCVPLYIVYVPLFITLPPLHHPVTLTFYLLWTLQKTLCLWVKKRVWITLFTTTFSGRVNLALFAHMLKPVYIAFSYKNCFRNITK